MGCDGNPVTLAIDAHKNAPANVAKAPHMSTASSDRWSPVAVSWVVVLILFLADVAMLAQAWAHRTANRETWRLQLTSWHYSDPFTGT